MLLGLLGVDGEIVERQDWLDCYLPSQRGLERRGSVTYGSRRSVTSCEQENRMIQLTFGAISPRTTSRAHCILMVGKLKCDHRYEQRKLSATCFQNFAKHRVGLPSEYINAFQTLVGR
jgi:hypothetical protein